MSHFAHFRFQAVLENRITTSVRDEVFYLGPHIAQIDNFHSNTTCFIDKRNGYLRGRNFVLTSVKLLCTLPLLHLYHLAHLAEHIFHLNVGWLAK